MPALAAALASGPALASAPPCTAPCIVTTNYNVISHSVTTVNGVTVDQYQWFDSKKLPRTLSLKKEGNGNSGHGGYAVQLTYVKPTSDNTAYYTITVNAENSGDGGFGYFVSHERYRQFADGTIDTIASHIFGADDSPLGLDYAVTESFPKSSAGTTATAAIEFATTYHHYGTIMPIPVDPNTGLDQTPLPAGKANYKLYNLPVKAIWLIEALKDDPHIIEQVSLAQVPTADLVNFDLRGPYGVMVFDNGADGNINLAAWGDEQYQFMPTIQPVTRSTGWNWSAANTGARYTFLQAGGYEMGLYEPIVVTASHIVDGYSAERGFTRQTFAASGQTSDDSCAISSPQNMPSDGEWPYQSIQYSLPCPMSNTPAAIHAALTTPAQYKKMAWGSSAYYGSSLTGVYNGQTSYPFDGFPSNHLLQYSVCLSLDLATTSSVTKTKAAYYKPNNPNQQIPECAAGTITGS